MNAEENERLTRVGPGTPCGALLRRYWWPIAFSAEVTDRPFPARLLAEDLVLFRDGTGRVGLLERHCPHRGASLELGRVEADGLRCCYHGWKFDAEGRCLDMPAEPADTPLRDEVRPRAYATREAAGFVFAYLGPDPVPELPRYDLLVRPDCNREVWAKNDYCNWLQRAENGYDPAHLGVLHAAVYPQLALKRPEVTRERTWYGFRTASRFPGQLVNVSHQIFPSHTRRTGSRVGDPPRHFMHFRVPVDDALTTTFYIRAEIVPDGPGSLEFLGRREVAPGAYERVEDGWWGIASSEQDRAAQESQGPIHDRRREVLGTTDAGIVMFRRLVREQIDAVAAGRDPVGVIRKQDSNSVIRFDASKNFADGTDRPPEMIGA